MIQLPVNEAQINAKKGFKFKALVSDSAKYSIFDSCQVADIIKEVNM